MHWLALVIAGLFEVVWAVGLKYTCGFTRFLPSLFVGGSMLVSVFLLSLALKTIPVGTGYAVWTGIGASGTLLVGIFYLGESRDPIRLACILVIIACMFILKMTHK